MNVLVLVERWLAARYVCDSRGRLLHPRGPGLAEAPRFHLVRTPLGNLWRLRADVPRETAIRLATLAGREPPLDDSIAEPEREVFIRSALDEHAPIVVERAGTILGFPLLPADAVSPRAEIRVLQPRDLPCLHPDLATGGVDAEHLARPDCLGVWQAGQIVAVCHTAFAGDTGVSEVYVATAQQHRRLGHASSLLRAWCRTVRASGGEPLVSASWHDDGVPELAQGLGLERLGEDRSWL